MSTLNARGVSRRVKVFGSDGQLQQRRLSQKKAEQLVSEKNVLAKRNRRGEILTIRYHGIGPATVLSTVPHAKYSYQEQVDGGKVWTHRRLPGVPLENGLSNGERVAQMDQARRAVFSGAVQSVITLQAPATSEYEELRQAA